MSVTIRTGVLDAIDQTGTQHGIDVITDKSTEDRKKEIDAKAEAAKASIPKDYTALTQEVSAIKDDLSHTKTLNGYESIVFRNDSVIETKTAGLTSLDPITLRGIQCSIIDCTEGDKFIITLASGNFGNGRAWCFVGDFNSSTQRYAALSYCNTGEAFDNAVIEAPAGAKKLVLNNDTGVCKNAVAIKGVAVNSRISNLEENISQIPIENILPTNLPKEYIDKDVVTKNGVTFTKNDDGSITLNGTSNADATTYNIITSVIKYPIEKGVYTISGVTGGAANTYRLYAGIKNSSGADIKGINVYDKPVTFEITEDNCSIRINIYIALSGVTFNNVKLYPMLIKGSIQHTYIAPGISAEKNSDSIKNLNVRMDTVEKKIENFGDCQVINSFDDLKNTTSSGVVVLHNNSQYGDNGVCCFSVREGETTVGYERNDGSVVFPIANQGTPHMQEVPKKRMMSLIRSYNNNPMLKYGSPSLFETPVLDDGQYKIDCSAFVSALLYGISYENSKYNGNANNIVAEDGIILMSNYSRLVTLRMAQYFAEKKCLYELPTDNVKRAVSQLQFGDILFESSYAEEDFEERYYATDHVMFVLGVSTLHSRIIVAQGGGTTGTWVSDGNNVCKITAVHLTDELLGHNYKIFARPKYNLLGSTEGDDLLMCSLTGKRFEPFFLPFTYIDGARGEIGALETYASTPKFYPVISGKTVKYTGEKVDSNGAALMCRIGEYDSSFKLISRADITNNGKVLSDNTKYIRFDFGHAAASNINFNLKFADYFNATII